MNCRILAIPLLWLSASASADPDRAPHVPPGLGTFLPPAMGMSYTDPVFAVSIKRLSDAVNMPNNANTGFLPLVSTEYATASPWNADNTRLILQHHSYFGLYDGSGTYLRDLPFAVHASSEPRWSRTDPNVLFYVSGNSLRKLAVAEGVSTVVRSFSEYAAIRGLGESDIGRDGDHFVFAADAPARGQDPAISNRYVFVYEISTDTKGLVLDVAGHAFDNLYLSPDNSVLVGWTESGTKRYSGIELFDRSMTFVRQLTHTIGHMHLTRETDGDDVLIWTNSNDPQPIADCQNGIVKVRLADARQTCLLQLDWGLAVHITAGDGNGWAFVGTYSPPEPLTASLKWPAFADEILQVKLDGSEVRRLLHHRSRPVGTSNIYGYQPRATVSRDGTRLVFTSNYNLQLVLGRPNDYTDAYMVVIPSLSPSRISIADTKVFEGETGAVDLKFAVRLSSASDLSVTVAYSTLDGTAVALEDYAPVTAVLTFAPGETVKTISVPVHGDTVAESNEGVGVRLMSPTNAVLDRALGVGTILDDDSPSDPSKPSRAQASWHGFFAVSSSETPDVGDFDGDGRIDIVTFTRENPAAVGDVYVALSEGARFGPASKWHDWFAISKDEVVVIGDYDGDGRSDIATWLKVSTREVYVTLSTGSGLTPEQVWSPGVGGDPGDLLKAGDVNGDGKSDLILFVRTQGKVYVSLSDGKAFSPPVIWHNWFAVSVEERPRVGDVNGDGRADIVTFATDSPTAFGDVYVALSNGVRFVDTAGQPDSSTKWQDWFAIRPTEDVQIGDLNGDGKADFFTFLPPPFAQCYTATSEGSFLGESVLWPEPIAPLLAQGDVVRVGDVNGDGRADIIVFAQKEGRVYVSLAPPPF